MTDAGDKTAVIPITGGKPAAVIVNAPAVGDRVVVTKDKSGKYVMLPVFTPVVGDKVISMPTSSGKPVIIQCNPNPGTFVMVGTRNYLGQTWWSYDKGATWESRKDLTITEPLVFIYAGAGVAYHLSNDGVIKKSADYGLSWESFFDYSTELPGYAILINMILLDNGNLMFLVGEGYGSHIIIHVISLNTSTKVLTDLDTSFNLETKFGASLIYTKDKSVLLEYAPWNNSSATYYGYYDARIIRSDDNGATWSESLAYTGGSAATTGSLPMLCDCGGDSILMATTLEGANTALWRSANDGIDWTRISDMELAASYGYPLFSPSPGIVMFGGTADGTYYNVYRSPDYGDTWSVRADFNMTLGNINSWSYLGNSIVIGYEDTGDVDGTIIRSTDNGLTWVRQTASPIPGGGWCILTITDHPR